MKEVSQHLRSEYAGAELNEALLYPTRALLGVSAGAADALRDIGIERIFDLGSSWLFANARAASEASRPNTISGRIGHTPADWLKPGVNPDSLDRIGDLAIEHLSGITEAQSAALAANLDVVTIRDLAYWPPRQVAQKLVTDSVGTGIDLEELQSEVLRPRLGEYPTERVYYNQLAMLQVGDSAAGAPLDAPVSLAPTVDPNLGFGKPAVGAYLTFSQSWYARGVTLGHMLHSLALAPGEATRIAVIDWSRRTSTEATEAITESEQLQNSTNHARAMSEVQNAVAEELQRGGSISSGWAKSQSESEASSGGSGILETSILGGGSGSTTSQEASTMSRAESTSWSVGNRSVSATMTQNINDRTEQFANSVRNRRASAIREVSQSEHEEVSTRVVANYNHMHALTVQYYEVIQIYQVTSQLHRAERCIFVPFELLNFDAPQALELVERFRGSLIRSALTRRARDLLTDDTTMVAIKPKVKIRLVRPDLIPPFTLPELAPAISATAAEDAKPAAATNPAAAHVAVAPVWDRNQVLKVSRLIGRSMLRRGSDAIHLTDDTELLGISFSGIGISSIRLDRPGVAAETNTYSVPPSTGYVDLPSGIRLADLEAIYLAKDRPPADSGAMFLHCAFRGRPFSAPSIPIELAAGTTMQQAVVLETDEANRQQELLAHLQANRAYYSQAAIRSLDSATIVMLLSPFSWNGKPLVEQVEPTPLAAAGNFLVLRAPVEPGESSGIEENGTPLDWATVLNQRGMDSEVTDTRMVPVPTDGVFAEAVLGRSNSAEKLDITRYWNWQDSPIPLQPTEISSIGTGSRGTVDDLTPGPLGAPVLNIVNPTSLPDPAGLSASLGTLASANVFRDMSGLQGTQAIIEAALKETLKATSQAGQLATTNLQTEAQRAVAMGQIAGDIAKAAMGVPPSGSTQGISADGARINHGRDLDGRGVKSPGGTRDAAPGSSPGGDGERPGGGQPSKGDAGAVTANGFSREGAYADRGAFGFSPDAVGVAASVVPAAMYQPELLMLCEALRQKKAQWESVKRKIVDFAQDEFVNRWGSGTKIESDPAMQSILHDYWQEPAFHGMALPLKPTGYIGIPDDAWSAVFIAWVVGQAGGGDCFSKVNDEARYRRDYRPIAHWRYLAPAKINQESISTSNPFWAYPIGTHVPEIGDIIVRSRGNGAVAHATWNSFEKKETHGDIVVEVDRAAGTYSVLGGNKSSPACSSPDEGCTVNRQDGLRLDADGFVDPPYGTGGHRWFALIRINTSIFLDPRCDTSQPGAIGPTNTGIV